MSIYVWICTFIVFAENSKSLWRVIAVFAVGNYQIFYNDIRTADIFMSPTYYLQQNDIVYVEPKYKDKSGEDRAWQISSFVISLASLFSSLIWALSGAGFIGG